MKDIHTCIIYDNLSQMDENYAKRNIKLHYNSPQVANKLRR